MTYSHDAFWALEKNTTIASHWQQCPQIEAFDADWMPYWSGLQVAHGWIHKAPSIIKRDTGVWHPLRCESGSTRPKALRVATIQQWLTCFIRNCCS